MKKRVVIGLISLLSLAAYAIQNPGLERRISIGSSPIVVLSGDDCRIVLQPEASLVTRFAADELQEFLSQVLGAKIAIVTVPGKRNNIYLGFGELARKSGMQPETLARDGFYIRTVGEGHKGHKGHVSISDN